MEYLYVLQLTGGKYYVGKTTDVIKRFEQHKTGSGSAWTKLHQPMLLVEARPIATPHDENNVTKDYMKKYGINNVRGGSYAQIKLPDEMNTVLELEFRGNNDLCVKCGLAGHFANKCTSAVPPTVTVEEEWECEFCDQTFATKNECIAHSRACRIVKPDEEWECEYCDRTFTTKYGCSVHERTCRTVLLQVEDVEQLECDFCDRTFTTKIGRSVHERSCCGQVGSGKKAGACYRCGRAGHYAPACYARTHVDGSDLE